MEALSAETFTLLYEITEIIFNNLMIGWGG